LVVSVMVILDSVGRFFDAQIVPAANPIKPLAAAAP